MAANTHLSVAAWNRAIDAALNVLDGGLLEIYDGVQPATPDVAVSTQNKLAKLFLATPAFGAAAGGTKTANPIINGTGLVSSTATWFRAFRSDDATAVIDGSVGTVNADMIVNTTTIAGGTTVSVTSWTVSMPIGQ